MTQLQIFQGWRHSDLSASRNPGDILSQTTFQRKRKLKEDMSPNFTLIFVMDDYTLVTAWRMRRMVAQPEQEGKLGNFIVLPFLFVVLSNALRDSAWSQKFLFSIFDKLLSPGSIKISVPGSL